MTRSSKTATGPAVELAAEAWRMVDFYRDVAEDYANAMQMRLTAPRRQLARAVRAELDHLERQRARVLVLAEAHRAQAQRYERLAGLPWTTGIPA